MESRKKIIFLGDSITDAGHDLQMAPEGQSRLGDGYVSRIAAMLGAELIAREWLRRTEFRKKEQ